MSSLKISPITFDFIFFDSSLESVFDLLREDYSLFNLVDAHDSKATNYKIKISHIKDTPQAAVALINEKVPLFVTNFANSYNWNDRWILFDGDHYLKITGNTIEVFGSEVNSLHEFLYVIILSLIGEELDSLGWHRLHSISFLYRDSVYCLLLPSKGGKSTLASNLITDSRFALVGDEIVITNGNILRPFPLKISTNDSLKGCKSQIFERKKFPTKWMTDYSPPKNLRNYTDFNLLIGGRALGLSLSRASFIDYLKLSLYCLLGWGTPQMREVMLRGGKEIAILKNAISRFFCLMRLARKKCSRFSYDFSHLTADHLADLLDSNLTLANGSPSLKGNESSRNISLLS